MMKISYGTGEARERENAFGLVKTEEIRKREHLRDMRLRYLIKKLIGNCDYWIVLLILILTVDL